MVDCWVYGFVIVYVCIYIYNLHIYAYVFYLYIGIDSKRVHDLPVVQKNNQGHHLKGGTNRYVPAWYRHRYHKLGYKPREVVNKARYNPDCHVVPAYLEGNTGIWEPLRYLDHQFGWTMTISHRHFKWWWMQGNHSRTTCFQDGELCGIIYSISTTSMQAPGSLCSRCFLNHGCVAYYLTSQRPFAWCLT